VPPAEASKPEAAQARPEPRLEEKPLPASAPAQPAAAQAQSQSMYEVKKGDTLGAIARQHLPAGVTLNPLLIAIYLT
jgi:pilus assembly protein FimV